MLSYLSISTYDSDYRRDANALSHSQKISEIWKIFYFCFQIPPIHLELRSAIRQFWEFLCSTLFNLKMQLYLTSVTRNNLCKTIFNNVNKTRFQLLYPQLLKVVGDVNFASSLFFLSFRQSQSTLSKRLLVSFIAGT